MATLNDVGIAPPPCAYPCDHCRPDEWHGCVLGQNHDGWHTCQGGAA